jgi:hypothetical protein
MFKIEKNIPLPTKTQDAEKYPFNQMEIGDSFVASRAIANFSRIIEDVKHRNDSGDNRFFMSYGTSGLQGDELRIWRTF